MRPKASITNRIVAKIIDIIIVVAVAVILPYPLGPLLGFIYSILADGMNHGPFKGQSIGKKIMKLQVVSLKQERMPAGYKDSAFRNAPVGVATFFAIIPIWGWIILALIGLPLMAIEIYLMVRIDTGHRLGDVMGDTEVIEVRGA
ncbi:MAG: hypothetical protein A2583_01850 [Bdellovibrionales bacterium RIFOXYD1_FULL_53_11]|nr:MAG: hypothetical protein A2583_01850 [Bdellovibrionales bacterium RIFOXYD1_FULL_53_11]